MARRVATAVATVWRRRWRRWCWWRRQWWGCGACGETCARKGCERRGFESRAYLASSQPPAPPEPSIERSDGRTGVSGGHHGEVAGTAPMSAWLGRAARLRHGCGTAAARLRHRRRHVVVCVMWRGRGAGCTRTNTRSGDEPSCGYDSPFRCCGSCLQMAHVTAAVEEKTTFHDLWRADGKKWACRTCRSVPTVRKGVPQLCCNAWAGSEIAATERFRALARTCLSRYGAMRPYFLQVPTPVSV